MLRDEFIEIFSLWVIYRVWIVCYKFTCVSRVCSFTHTTLIIRFWFDHIEITHVKTCADKILSLQWLQGLRRLATFSPSIKKQIVCSDAQEQNEAAFLWLYFPQPAVFFPGHHTRATVVPLKRRYLNNYLLKASFSSCHFTKLASSEDITETNEETSGLAPPSPLFVGIATD